MHKYSAAFLIYQVYCGGVPMKKNLLSATATFMAAAILMFSAGSAVHARTIRLTYSIFFPPTHEQCKTGMMWAEEIEKQTDGAVTITVFPGGTLTKANQCYDGVEKGISDIGMSCFAYNRGRFPVMEAVDLPLGYPNGQTATHVANDFFQALQPGELDGVKVLYIHAHGPGLLHTQRPVNSLADLKGMKIRSTGLSAKVAEALGAVPVAMPQPSTYEALQKGVVEGTFAPIETLKGWRQAEVIKHTTDCRSIGYTTSMYVVMNLKKWNSLPKEIQDVFESVSNKWIDVHGSTWDRVDIEGKTYTQSLGNDIIELKPAEHQKWKAAVEPIIQNYASEKSKKGIDGKHVISTLRSLIEKYSAVYVQ